MLLKSLDLINFRNYHQQKLEKLEKLNIIYGNNGVGKTNLLEAIYYLAAMQSPRARQIMEIIEWGKKSFKIAAQLENNSGSYHVALTGYENGEKSAEINKTKQNYAMLKQLINVVFFTPEDLYLVKGSPDKRRKFLDDEIRQISYTYGENLQKYYKVLVQRNNLLKKAAHNRSLIKQLEVWDEQLIDYGSSVIKKRLDFLQKLRPLARLMHRKLAGNHTSMELTYFGIPVEVAAENSLEKLNLFLQDELDHLRNKEIERGITLFGPQRHDLLIKADGIDTRIYASQGQQRTIALALRLAELELIKAETGEYPLLLLDDVFSELDEIRRKLLFNTVFSRVQTFISTTDLHNLEVIPEEVLKIRIESAKGGPICTCI